MFRGLRGGNPGGELSTMRAKRPPNSPAAFQQESGPLLAHGAHMILSEPTVTAFSARFPRSAVGEDRNTIQPRIPPPFRTMRFHNPVRTSTSEFFYVPQMAVNAGQSDDQRTGNHRDRNGQSGQPHVFNRSRNFLKISVRAPNT